MAFAADYLQKHAVQDTLSDRAVNKVTDTIICIPAYNESGLMDSLDSLFSVQAAPGFTEVLVLINDGAGTSDNILKENQRIYAALTDWVGQRSRPDMAFVPLYASGLGMKHFGAGLARKLVMDEAVRRFEKLNRPSGILLSLDADTIVAEDYLVEVKHFFAQHPDADGCSVYFEHPTHGSTFPREVYEAVTSYELHLRYYLEGLRHAGCPNACHTVGSAFAVRAGSYCRFGGMSRRQAGEDFYFIQKVAAAGLYAECNSTAVYPSPRPSDRVPFGTGPAVRKAMDAPGEPFMTYHPRLFEDLRPFFTAVDALFTASPEEVLYEVLGDELLSYLEKTGFPSSLEEIKANTASIATFRKRFFTQFNMFWILKYLHYAEESGQAKMEISKAAAHALQWKGLPAIHRAHSELLAQFRNLQRSA